MEGWRQWRLGRGYVCKKREKNFLTPTGLLMEGVSTQNRQRSDGPTVRAS